MSYYQESSIEFPSPIFGDLRDPRLAMPMAPVAQQGAYAAPLHNHSSRSTPSSISSSLPRTPSHISADAADAMVYVDSVEGYSGYPPRASHSPVDKYPAVDARHYASHSRNPSSSSSSSSQASYGSHLASTAYYPAQPMDSRTRSLSPPEASMGYAQHAYSQAPSGYVQPVAYHRHAGYAAGSSSMQPTPPSHFPAPSAASSSSSLSSSTQPSPTFIAYSSSQSHPSRHTSPPQPAPAPAPSRLVTVPQKQYKSAYAGIQDRIALRPGATNAVIFGANGVRVKDALAGRLDGMEDKDDEVLDDVHAKTNSVRIWWPGYKKCWRGDLDCSRTMTRKTLAASIARRIHKFYETTANAVPTSDQIDNKDDYIWWRLGHGGIRLEDIVIERVERVTHGSWQPVLRVYRH